VQKYQNNLRHWVGIEYPYDGSRNSYGEPSRSWLSNGATHAAIMPLTGAERFAAQQVQAATTHRVVMRYASGTTKITPEMRLRHGRHSAANAVGTATGGGAGWILLEDNGTQADDLYNKLGVVITGGTGRGQYRVIADYDHTGNVNGERYCQVATIWDTNPDDTSTYMILERILNIESIYTPDELGAWLELLCVEVP
jgi:SPP1 family predicted phage head-tail adaptor